MSASSDRNLLFGVVALQKNFINRDAFIAALHAWVLDKSRTLGNILVQQGALQDDQIRLLESQVEIHLARHGHDPAKSLAAIDMPALLRRDLHNLTDPDVQASLSCLPTPSAQQELGPLPATGSWRAIAVSAVGQIGQAEPAPSPSPGTGEKTDRGMRYHILRPHDKGGIGEVFVAVDQELNRQVALKEIQGRHAGEPYSRGRFVREAEITGGLEHPGIVPVYGLGQYADGRPYYAMRFIRGQTLKEAIARHHSSSKGDAELGSPEPALRALLMRFVAVCNTLAYAHSRGVLHRDIKPANIMLGQYGETLVVDWGMARIVAEESKQGEGLGEPTLVPRRADSVETQPGAAMGTPAYMSPEQAAGRLDLLGPASDIYSLGATLYALLTGRPPIQGRDMAELIRKAERGDGCLRVRSSRMCRPLWTPSAARRWPRGRQSATRRRWHWRRMWSIGWPTSRWPPTASRGPLGRDAGCGGTAH